MQGFSKMSLSLTLSFQIKCYYALSLIKSIFLWVLDISKFEKMFSLFISREKKHRELLLILLRIEFTCDRLDFF